MPLSPNLEVGPFHLIERIGVGGMGEVWRAAHHRTGAEVAIKVITSHRASQEKYRESFQREVQAVAALNHPGVVAIYEYGELAETNPDTGEPISLPWYAMEIANTSLAEVRIGDWPTLRRILVEILDALAHAHARGVIHRDLKPENVLLNHDMVVKLTDFGMAHVVEFTEDTSRVFGPGGGTPDFMAPEQFRGEWRKFGAWTDLYAIGCLAWELATGRPPHPGSTVIEIAMQHLNDPPPRLNARFDLPERFEIWLKRLIQKHPLDRFRRAADAQWALVQDVGDVGGASPKDVRLRARPGTPTTADDLDIDTHEIESLKVRRRDTLDDANLMTLEVSYALTPPFPGTWITDHVPSRLDGAGLGLFGIREIPFVGREKERQAVWSALARVDAHSENHLIVVHGEPGVGRTRFGQWISRRAHELGAATVIRATHGPIPNRSDGLAGAVTRFLGIEGVDEDRARDIVQDRLGPTFDSSVLLDLLFHSGREDSHGTSTFAAPAQRFAAVASLFKALSWERPVIFFADDVQWGADTLLFAQHLLQQSEGHVLVLATVRSDALPDRYWESQLVGELEANPRSTKLRLPPLSDDERRELIGHMLGLDPDLQAKVVKRSQGVPLFAVQLVGDWVQRGLLEETPTGFRLVEGSRVELPDDVYALWTQRIDDLASSLNAPQTREILEVAALLGGGIAGEWAPVVAKLGMKIPPELEEQLVTRRLAVRDANGWFFQHGMLRESLERSALESGRAEKIYGACADVLERDDPYRIAEFEVRAGRYDRAITSLLDALEVGVVTLAIDQAVQVVELVEELLEETGTPESDARRGKALGARITLLRLRGDLKLARDRASELVERAHEHGWDRLRAYGHLHLGGLGEVLGQPIRDVLAHYDEALATFDALDDDRGRARAFRALADYQLNSGKPKISANLTRKALKLMEEHNDIEGIVEAEVALGDALFVSNELDTARERYETARDEATLHGLRHFVAWAHTGLGRIAVDEGEFDAAAENFEEAIRLWASIGSNNSNIAIAHLAALDAERRDVENAAELLASVELAGHPELTALVSATEAQLLALEGRVESFDASLRELRSSFDENAPNAKSVLRCVFGAGRAWADRGDRQRARRAYDFARNRYMAIGAQKQADAVAIAIGKL